MTLKHRAKFINPALKDIKDPATVQAFQELMEQLSDLWPNVYDDLKNNGIVKNDFDNNVLKLLQALSGNRSAVSSNPYAVTSSDLIIGIDTTSADITINLPAATNSGRILIIKDEAGNASGHNITIDGSGAETIDGAATVTISTDYGYRVLYSDGTEWHITGSN